MTRNFNVNLFWINNHMSIKNYYASIQMAENNKFVEITNDARFPNISVVRTYPTGATELQTFPKYASLVYVVNQPDGSSGGWDITQAVLNGSASYVNFPSNSASSMTVYNSTGVMIDVRKTNGSFFYPLSAGLSLTVPITGNTNEVQVRRSDQQAGVLSAYAIFTT